MKVALFAPSSVVPKAELTLGLEKLKSAGFDLRVHPQCAKMHQFYSGKDADRVKAFADLAWDPSIEVFWAARGGYGATRLLPELEKLTRKKGKPPKKLLIGFSDITGLYEFCIWRWGWSVLHGPMPGLMHMQKLTDFEWTNLLKLVRGKAPKAVFPELKGLKIYGPRTKLPLKAELVGGNLSLLSAIHGTPFEMKTKGKIVFIEEVDELLYRVDRYLWQLMHAGFFKGARAIVFGSFTACEDRIFKVRTSPHSEKKAWLRPLLKAEKYFAGLCQELADELRIPVIWGYPNGHGPRYFPMPIGAKYELNRQGKLRMLSWDWIHRAAGHRNLRDRQR